MCIIFISFIMFVFITIVKNNQFRFLSLFESESDFYLSSAISDSSLQTTDKWTVSFKNSLCKQFYVKKINKDHKFFIHFVNNAYMIHAHF